MAPRLHQTIAWSFYQCEVQGLWVGTLLKESSMQIAPAPAAAAWLEVLLGWANISQRAEKPSSPCQSNCEKRELDALANLDI